MREIKFRVWDSFCGGWSKNSINLLYDKDGIISFEMGTRYALMQFTGLYDKHGREIYEGDIVKTTDGIEESIHEIKYCIDFEYPAFELVPTPDVGCNALQHAICSGDEEIEVIGNIYESPELL